MRGRLEVREARSGGFFFPRRALGRQRPAEVQPGAETPSPAGGLGGCRGSGTEDACGVSAGHLALDATDAAALRRRRAPRRLCAGPAEGRPAPGGGPQAGARGIVAARGTVRRGRAGVRVRHLGDGGRAGIGADGEDGRPHPLVNSRRGWRLASGLHAVEHQDADGTEGHDGQEGGDHRLQADQPAGVDEGEVHAADQHGQ